MALQRVDGDNSYPDINDHFGSAGRGGDSDSPGSVVSDWIPGIFESYCKIFHAMWEAPGGDEEVSWNDAKQLDEDDPVDQVLADARVTYATYDESEPVRRLRWEVLAHRLGLTFHPEIHSDTFTSACGGSWPRNVYGPEEGALYPASSAARRSKAVSSANFWTDMRTRRRTAASLEQRNSETTGVGIKTPQSASSSHASYALADSNSCSQPGVGSVCCVSAATSSA